MGQSATASCYRGQQPRVEVLSDAEAPACLVGAGAASSAEAGESNVGEVSDVSALPRLLGAADAAVDTKLVVGETREAGEIKGMPMPQGAAAATAHKPNLPTESGAASTPQAADPRFSDPSHPDYIPMTLRHGPRELRHMRHLGLIKADDASDNIGTSTALAAPPAQAKTAEVEASRKSAPPPAVTPWAPAPAATPLAKPAPNGTSDPRFFDRTHPDYVPIALRHGPRELRHMQHLGLIKAADTPGVVAAGGRGGAGRAMAAEKNQKQRAVAAVKEFLSSHGFTGVNDRRRQHVRKACPLHVAVRANDVAMVRLLLGAGADPRGEDSFGRSPLRLARKLGSSYAAIVAALEGRL